MTQPEIFYPAKTDHIYHMTDDTGMLQHSCYSVPNLSRGYSSDDNARALIMAVLLDEQKPTLQTAQLIHRYLAFMFHVQNEDGTFRNFMEFSRTFTEKVGSGDNLGRSLWGLGFAWAQSQVPDNMKKAILDCITPAIPHCANLEYPRSRAYAILGLSYLETEDAKAMLILLADALADQYEQNSDGSWHWFEDTITYCNSILPRALLRAYQKTGILRYRQIALESLDFLETKTFRDGYFKPIGCKGWLKKNGTPAEYDEQPVEAGETTLAYLDAYEITGEKRYYQKAVRTFAWYYGMNSRNQSMIDPDTGGCYDGICEDGLNLNQGAESLVSYWIACLSIQKYPDNIIFH